MNLRARALDEIEAAHASVGGTGPGRRYATQQSNQAYAMLLASQFQGFCRDLHTESVDQVMALPEYNPSPYYCARTPLALSLQWTGTIVRRGDADPPTISDRFIALAAETRLT